MYKKKSGAQDMPFRHAAQLVATASLLLLAAVMPAQADNVNTGFTRETLAIGTVANRISAESGDKGDEKAAEKGAGASKKTRPSKTVEIHASAQLDPASGYELHAYSAEFDPHGHSNWHSHPGLELSIHSGGIGNQPMIFYILNRDGSCRRHELSHGQSLLLMPNETHVAINEASQKNSLIVERIHPGDSQVLPVTRDEAQPYGNGCPVI